MWLSCYAGCSLWWMASSTNWIRCYSPDGSTLPPSQSLDGSTAALGSQLSSPPPLPGLTPPSMASMMPYPGDPQAEPLLPHDGPLTDTTTDAKPGKAKKPRKKKKKKSDMLPQFSLPGGEGQFDFGPGAFGGLAQPFNPDDPLGLFAAWLWVSSSTFSLAAAVPTPTGLGLFRWDLPVLFFFNFFFFPLVGYRTCLHTKSYLIRLSPRSSSMLFTQLAPHFTDCYV